MEATSPKQTYLDQPQPIGIDHHAHLIVLSSQLKCDPRAGLHVLVSSQSRTNDEDVLRISSILPPSLKPAQGRTSRSMMLFRSFRISSMLRFASRIPCTMRSGELPLDRVPCQIRDSDILCLDHRAGCRLADDMREIRAEAQRAHGREERCSRVAARQSRVPSVSPHHPNSLARAAQDAYPA